MPKKMKCSNCGKRAFDISELPKQKFVVELKCPHCGKVVRVPCDEHYVLKAS